MNKDIESCRNESVENSIRTKYYLHDGEVVEAMYFLDNYNRVLDFMDSRDKRNTLYSLIVKNGKLESVAYWGDYIVKVNGGFEVVNFHDFQGEYVEFVNS